MSDEQQEGRITEPLPPLNSKQMEQQLQDAKKQLAALQANQLKRLEVLLAQVSLMQRRAK